MGWPWGSPCLYPEARCVCFGASVRPLTCVVVCTCVVVHTDLVWQVFEALSLDLRKLYKEVGRGCGLSLSAVRSDRPRRGEAGYARPGASN